ncbi:T9SS type A sorting domain-containing protein [Frigoriflavimonas asaccharolytica]|uniref:Secretion system C-terminal sorting domain-containing protein n=1 Tax=Frigoriflavimonas asaccharolytica TaxID=2735899 RepID=A0A8J8G799_9FLAO|nr:T9SS type A sorting domain-containing protein [Frigoriflavimonas asaccharolytica]NRS92803.1 hypothetical protein [Frigoriflavimonas asaccharolytica]
MKKLYILLILAIAQSSFAQTTLTDAANKPVVGNSYAANAVTGTVDNSATGASATFSNPTVTSGAATTTTFVSPTAAEITTFPGSNLKQDDGSGTVLLFKSTANKLEITGLTNSTATLNFAANNGTYLQFPTAFNYNVTDNAQGTFTSTAASGLFKGTIVGTSGASGTLIVGGRTFTNVLRVKIVQTYNLHGPTDTFFIFPIGTLTTTSYLYYDNLRKFPLLTDTTGTAVIALAGINQTDNFAIAQDIVFLGNQEVNAKNSIFMYPNPAEDIVNFEGLSKNQKLVKIYTADGRLVLQDKIENNQLNVSKLSSGNYFITISGDNSETKPFKLIKK